MSQPELTVKQSGFGGRGYRIPGRRDQYGKAETWPGVTTVLKQVAKPGLHQWIADQTAAYAVANIARLNDYSDERSWGYLRFYWSREPDQSKAIALRSHADGVRDDAAELGTNLHEIADAWLEGSTMPNPTAPEVDEMMDAFEEFCRTHRVERHWGEFTVVDDDRRVAGTADGDWTITCLHDGPGCFHDGTRGPHRCLVDVKTSRWTWPEHGMQVAFLAQADIAMVRVQQGEPGAMRFEKTEDGKKRVSWWIERFQPSYDRTVLLHIRPRDLSPSGDRIEAFAELVDTTKDSDLHLQGFDGALALARTMRGLKARGDVRALVGK